MKRFQFSLQSVHDLRQSQRDDAERGLAQASAKVSAANAALDEIARLRAHAIESHLSTFQAGVLNPHEATLSANYFAALARREAEARERLAGLERERETRREQTVETTRAAETTAKLRERQRVRHTTEAARAEQNMLDEIAANIRQKLLRNR